MRRLTLSLIALLTCILIGTIGLVLAHEGHNKAFDGKKVSFAPTKVRVSREGQQAIGLKTMLVKPERLRQYMRVSGEVKPADNHIFQVSSTMPGTVTQVFVKEGESVQAGQTLAQLYSPELARMLTELLQERNSIQTEISRLQARFQEDIAIQANELELARHAFDREKTLFQEGITARKDYLQAEKQFASTKTRLETLQNRSAQEISLLKNQLRMTQQTVRSQLAAMGVSTSVINQALAENRVMANIPISAPSSGVLTARNLTVGMAIQPGQPLFTILQSSPVWIDLDVYSEQIPALALGQPVRIKTASNELVQGKIAQIGSQLRTDKRTLPVRVISSNPLGLLKPGMFVTAEIQTGQSQQQHVIVPKSAIITEQGRSLVFVRMGDEFQAVPVRLGNQTSDEAEILDGLYEGDEVVVQGAKQLYAQSLIAQSDSPTHHELHDDHPSQAGPLSALLVGLLLGASGSSLIWLTIKHRSKQKDSDHV